MKISSLVIGFVVLAGALSTPASSEYADYRTYFHQISEVELPGGGAGLALYGDLAYIPSDFALQIADVSDPQNLRVVGSVAAPGLCQAIGVQGTYAYVSGQIFDWEQVRYVGIMYVADLSDPLQPTILSSVTLPDPVYSQNVDLAGSYAYLAGGPAGLQIVDIADPSAPQVVGVEVVAGFDVTDVELAGSFAFVSVRQHNGSLGGLRVIDVSDSANPQIVGSVDAGYAWRVVITGAYAYLLSYGIEVVDVRDPANPRVVDALDVHGNGIVLTSTNAFVFRDDAILSVDITNPASPTPVGGLASGASGLAVREGTLFATSGYRQCNNLMGLRALDIANPRSPALASVPLPCGAMDVDVSGAYAYVADQECGLYVVDVTDPLSPSIVGNLSLPAAASGVAVKGGYAFVADTESFMVVDVTDPANPVIVDSLPCYAMRVSIEGDLAYVAAADGFHVFSIASPTHIYPMGASLPDTYLTDVVVDEGYAYVTAVGFMYVVQVSDPWQPRVVGSLAFTGWAVGAAKNGNCLCIARGECGLAIVDVSDPTTPRMMGHLPETSDGVALSGNLAYFSGLEVIDVSDMTSPDIIGGAFSGSWTYAVATGPAMVLVAGGGGLSIFPVHRESAGSAGGETVAVDTRIHASPNPAYDDVVVRVEMPNASLVHASVHDVTGRRVRGLYDGALDAGFHDLRWDGRDDQGRDSPAGIYLIRVSTASARRATPIVLLR